MLSWTNPTDPDFDHVTIVRKQDAEPSGIADGTEVYSGSDETFTDTESLADGTYYYAVYTCDASDNCMDTGTTTSVTLDTTPPASGVSNLTGVLESGEPLLTWTNPTEDDFDYIRLIRKEATEPANISDGTEVYTGSNETYTDTDDLSEATYYYAAYACDASENCMDTAEVTNVTIDLTPPTAGVSGLTSEFTGGKPVLSWTNPSEADYDHTVVIRKQGSAPTDMSDGDQVYSGADETYTDTDSLSNGTYYYAVYTCDAAGNCMETSEETSIEVDAVPPSVTNFTHSPEPNAAYSDGNIRKYYMDYSDFSGWGNTFEVTIEFKVVNP